MKLFEILREDATNFDRHQKRWNADELAIIVDKVGRTTMTVEDAKSLATELADSGEIPGRNRNGIWFAIIRMYAIIHGALPDGLVPNESSWFSDIPESMMSYAENRGYDVERGLQRAKRDWKAKVERKRRMVGRDQATQMMAQYYRDNKESLPPTVRQYREQIVQDIMNGLSPEEAFGRIIG